MSIRFPGRQVFRGTLAAVVLAAVVGPRRCAGGGTVRTGLEGIAWQSPETLHRGERAFVEALRDPLLAARDCRAALEHWFGGRTADARGDKEGAAAAWAAAVQALEGVAELGKPGWDEPGSPAPGRLFALEGDGLSMVQGYGVSWRFGERSQYGLLMLPARRPLGHRFPLLVYLCAGLDGLSRDEVAALGRQCRKGYAVVAMALRGECLLRPEPGFGAVDRYVSDGDPLDLRGSAWDVCAAIRGTWRLEVVRSDTHALVGSGRGGTVALLAAMHAPRPACVVAVDCWNLNPFRSYWQRVARLANCWEDWEIFCTREVEDQLLRMRSWSVVHDGEELAGPILLVSNRGDAGGCEDLAEKDFLGRAAAGDRQLEAHRVETMASPLPIGAGGGNDNHVYRLASRFLHSHYPPDDGRGTLPPADRTDTPPNPGEGP
ncbi:MAG: hypothetical protein JXR77_09600 [Lentisphaeria bacterium]|nr:hypothetical protein [Lentisphaeria bacterium]